MDRKKVILDIDGDFDNLLAVAYALESPELEVLGITTVHGLHSVEYTTRKVFDFLKSIGRTVPVAMGEALPTLHSRMDKTYTDEQISVTDGIEKDKASDFIYKTLMESCCKVTICMLGAATNVDMLITKYGMPAKAKIEQILFAGGSYFSGTITPSACHKVYCDAEAMQKVMHAGIPFKMISIDQTSGFTDGISCKDTVAEFKGVWSNYTDEAANQKRETQFIRTPLALTELTHPRTWDYSRYKCEIECHGKYTYGMTVVYLNHYCGMTVLDGRDVRLEASTAERNIQYCIAFDRNKAMDIVADRIRNLA